MPLSPPADFSPPSSERSEPGEEELRLLWRARERARRERGRIATWRGVVEGVRRGPAGDLRTVSPEVAIPAFARESGSFGPDSRAALRPVPRDGRVAAVGIDTISVCWYAEAGSALERAMRSLARLESRGAELLPEAVGGFRVGWFSSSGLVFAEGHPVPGGLCGARELPAALGRLDDDLWDLGIPAAAVPSGGVRRLDVAADLVCDNGSEGLGLLEALSGASFGVGRVAAYRAERCIESVVVRSARGRSLARVYDKAVERGSPGERGRWLRFEAQWRFPHGSRPSLDTLDALLVKDRFKRRFRPLWQASRGFRLGGQEVIVERVREAVRTGELRPSRARSVVGFLVLRSAGVAQGADRTVEELERECRELGISISLLAGEGRLIDLASVVDECLQTRLWS